MKFPPSPNPMKGKRADRMKISPSPFSLLPSDFVLIPLIFPSLPGDEDRDFRGILISKLLRVATVIVTFFDGILLLSIYLP